MKMKMKATQYLVAGSLLAMASSSSATVLFTDDFTVNGDGQGVATEDLNLRIGGTLGPAIITAGVAYDVAGSQHQIGNETTDTGQPGGGTAAGKDTALLAFNSSFRSTIDLGAVAEGPLTIAFDLYHNGANPGNGGDDDWAAFTVRATDPWPVAGAGEFGMLVRKLGGVQIFNNGGNVAPAAYDTIGYSTDDHWEITFTDTAGTGSAFDGNGSVMSFVNGANTGSITLDQLGSGLNFGFRNFGNLFAGVDNIVLTTVPEPSGSALCGLGLGLMALRRKRRA